MIDSQSTELAVIISHPTSVSAIMIVLSKAIIKKRLQDLTDFALQEQDEDNLMVVIFQLWYNG